MSPTSSLKLLPALAKLAPARAAQLNLSFSGYVAALVWNQSQAPAPLQAEPASAREVRVHVRCSWRRGLRPLVRQIARDSGLSANAAVEALIARDLRSADLALTILPARGSRKPRL